MNKEIWLCIMPALGWLLFALGGTQISDKIEGQKWIRRFLLPFICGVCLFIAHFAWFQALGVAILACIALHQGYGSKTPWSWRLLVFAGYGLISGPVGISWWNFLTAVGCIILYILSNTKITSKIVVWKVCEGSFGALIGIQISYLMAGNGLIWHIINPQ